MLKAYLIGVYSIVVFFLSWFTNPVELKMIAPQEVVAGVPFEVEVIINKGTIDGFARFQQELPKGFTAEVIDPATGDFKFEDQLVKLFWLIIPNKEEIVVRYRINTDVNVSGKYSLAAIFSYIDGDKKYAEMPLHEINITPSPLANQSTDSSKIEMQAPPQVTCQRHSVKINAQGEIEIELLVNRGELRPDQFAKIQEIVPRGFDAKSLETKGGIFTFMNNEAKFLWMTLPTEQEFLVAYKLIPEKDVNLKKLEIKGNFSYIVDGQTIEVPLTEMDKTVAEIVSEQLAYQQGDWKSATDTNETTVSDVADNTNNTNNNEVSDNNLADNNTQEDNIEASNNTNQIISIPQPDAAVHYRIQIAAGHKKIDTKPYFKKLKVKESVNVEMLEGWYKYTIGSYSQYLQARNKRNDIWAQTPITDAFVTAYNNGQRITVQEALMITNQTWYQ